MSATESPLRPAPSPNASPPAVRMTKRRDQMLALGGILVAIAVLLTLNFGSTPPAFTPEAPMTIGSAVLLAVVLYVFGYLTLTWARACPLCSRRMPRDSVFCPYCGSRLP